MAKGNMTNPEFDINSEAKDFVNKREWRYLNALGNMYIRFKNKGKDRQAQIVQDETVQELDRLDPRDKWSVENGDEVPQKPGKGGFSEWWDSIGRV